MTKTGVWSFKWKLIWWWEFPPYEAANCWVGTSKGAPCRADPHSISSGTQYHHHHHHRYRKLHSKWRFVIVIKKECFFPATARSYNDKVDDYMQVSSNAKEENIADKDWGNLAGEKTDNLDILCLWKTFGLEKKMRGNSEFVLLMVYSRLRISFIFRRTLKKKMKKWHICSFMLFAFKIS